MSSHQFDKRAARVTRWQLVSLVLLTLALHWVAMHLLATRWLREDRLAAFSMPHITQYLQAQDSSQDSWRHTSQGWEILKVEEQSAPRFALPSHHISLAQIWPAAWAACLTLSIVSIVHSTAAGMKRSNIDIGSAASYQVSHNVRGASR